MKKKETLTAYYKHCGEYPNAFDFLERDVDGYRCDKAAKIISATDLWGEIPDWCTLEDAE